MTAIDCVPSLREDLSIAGVRAAFREWLSSQAQRLVVQKHYDMEHAKNLARDAARIVLDSGTDQ